MSSTDRATGKDIILDIVENMRAYREELLYSSLVPTAFEVHLHPDDYARLEGIFPAIAAEARRALDEALGRHNRRVGPEWLHKLTRPGGPAQPAQEGWSITFFRDENDELRAGEVLIDSRLTLPQTPELGAGTRTRRITTSRIGQKVNTRAETIEATPVTTPPIPVPSVAPPSVAPAPISPAPADVIAPVVAVPPVPAVSDTPPKDATVRTVEPPVFATLTFEDKAGRHTHAVTASQVVIGRGGPGYWVDVRVEAAQDVSREHVKLRRDSTTGQFFLKDVSLYGTTINGQRVASSIDSSNGAKTDLNLEVPLPSVARIGLADMVFVDFRLGERS